jgi:hypothetical protein
MIWVRQECLTYKRTVKREARNTILIPLHGVPFSPPQQVSGGKRSRGRI